MAILFTLYYMGQRAAKITRRLGVYLNGYIVRLKVVAPFFLFVHRLNV